MEKLAVIGSGISGLGCAWMLHRDFEITVFEQNAYTGGHTHTVYIPEKGREIPVDSGFIVCNRENYPLLMRLFETLNVPLQETSMSFSAYIPQHNICYCGSSLNLLFAQRRNLFRPRYIRFLLAVRKFNAICTEVLEDDRFRSMHIADYVQFRNLGNDLLDWYLLPMASALWSSEPGASRDFPVRSLVRFFRNHGLLGLHTQYHWFTVQGGSDTYKMLLTRPFENAIRTRKKIVSICRQERGVLLRDAEGASYAFDRAIVATHADQALAMLGDADPAEKRWLGAFRYSRNEVVLHTDPQYMPPLKKTWSSWNYRMEQNEGAMQGICTYWMNRLQRVSERQDYFITLNPGDSLEKGKILRQFVYEHPVFDLPAAEAQEHLPSLNAGPALYFCGSYFRNGFHEDAFRSAVDVCEKILGRKIWK